MKKITAAITLIALILVASAQTPQGVLARFRVIIDNGYCRVTDARDGQYQGGISIEKRKSMGASTNNRHMALDVTAGVIAGGGSRAHTTDPNSPVVTLAESKDKNKAVTATEERGHLFVMASDTKAKGHYEAIVYLLK
jgi:hypothetical protein